MKQNKVTIQHSSQIRAAYQLGGMTGKALVQLFPQYCRATIFKHAKKPINGETIFDRRSLNKGRPRKISSQDERSILRSVRKLRKQEGSFTSRRIQVASGVDSEKVSNRTIRRCLNRKDIFYLQSRKKGLLGEQDLVDRLKFCKKLRKKKLNQGFWNTGISFYLDGKGFEFKTNPHDQARAPSAREWRKRGEGLKIGCVAKGKKEGSVNANFMVAISYGKGAVICKRYDGQITGAKFAAIVEKTFPNAFLNSTNPKGKLFLMDGCPRQNSKVAMTAIDKVGAKLFKIPSRSPDLNPIENFFHLVDSKLKADARQNNISKQTFKQFCKRVKDTVRNFPSSTIDAIIDSMDKRITQVIKANGQRIKY